MNTRRTSKSILTVLLGLAVIAMSKQAFGDTWATKASMPTARYVLAAIEINGLLYAVGGWDGGARVATVGAYDPVANSWTTKAPMLTPRSDLGIGVVNGILYAVGGYNNGPLTTVEAYDPVTDNWTTKAPMPTPRAAFGVGVVNGILYAVGGWNGVFLDTVEAYDPANNSWTTNAPMPTARAWLAAGVVNGLLYAAGGTGIGPTFLDLDTVEAYDPVTNAWATKTPMPTPRCCIGGGVVNGVLYAVGGRNTTGSLVPGSLALATVEAYDWTANAWATKASMPTARSYPAVGVVNGVLYAVGGCSANTTICVLDTVEAYDPDATLPVTLAPTADFTATPNPAQAGQSVAFDGLASHDNDSVGCDPTTDVKHCIVSYAWEFGDTATQTTSAPTTSHTYSAAGAYTATLTAIDNDGQITSLQHVIQVNEPPVPPPGCNMVGNVHGNQNFRAIVNGKAVNVHVVVDGDCDYNKKAKKVFLDHAKVHVTIGNGPPLIQAKQGDRHSDVSSVTLTSATATEPPKAVIKGTWGGSPFTVALTDGGKGNKSDTVQVTYPGFPASILSAPHATVHIGFN